MNFVTITSASRVIDLLRRECLISLTCVALMVGCGNDGRENAGAQLAQRGMTNSPAAFIKAVQDGDIVAVRLFLQAGMSANSRKETPEGSFAALHSAVNSGNIEIAALLLEKGADVNATAFGKDTPLHVALGRTNSNLAMVQLLVNNGADVNAVREGGGTALMQAVIGGNLEAVDLLLSKGADVNAKEMEGFTALMFASGDGNLAVVKALLKAKPDLEAKNGPIGRTAVEMARAKGHEEVVEALLKAKPDLEAKSGPEDRTAEELAREVDALRAATITRGQAAHTESAEEDNRQLKAREQLARLNLTFPDDFMRCVQNNDTLAVRLFLEARINTEQRDKADGWTALQHAAYNGNLKMTQLLLDHGANVLASREGDGRWRAEDIARERGHREVVELLVAAQKKFRASLGTAPGTYFQIEDTIDGAKTNEWVFTAEGAFRCYWRKGGNPDDLRFDGVYRVDGNKVLLNYQVMSSGQRDNRQLAITATGLSDKYFRLVKSSENR
ncbi:MAG: ankyrin repeat domain-containing protein [Verrucomicrobia bacterium]|nr:ankyrin repeat domain-containing protein [Verrucomicrobiota bacterium]